MPQIPDRHALGRVDISGAAPPAEINPMVAYDIGRAGQAWDKALNDVQSAFFKISMGKKKVEDDTWLAERKIETLKAEDELRRDTELNAGDDGTGFEEVPKRFEGTVKEQENVEGGTDEARQKYKLWAADRAYNNGAWAAKESQKRLKESSLRRLDDRLSELTNLATANPDKAQDYFNAFEEETRALIGTAIDAPSAASRIDTARGNILAAGVRAKIKKNPTDYAKAMKALEDAGVTEDKINARPRDGANRNDAIGRIAREMGINEQTARLFVRIESGGDPSARSGSFKGLLQLSQEEFEKHGGKGSIYDAEENLRAGFTKLKAEMERFEQKTGRKPSDLDIYMIHQQGEGGAAAHFKNPDGLAWQNMASTAEGRRKGSAWAKEAIWRNIPDDMKRFFPDGVESVTSRQFVGVWSMKIDRLRGGDVSPSQAIDMGVRLRDLPTVDGAVQPAELMSLKPEDFRAITGEIKPYLAAEMNERVKDASAALLASGVQSTVTDEDLRVAGVYANPKLVQEWKDALEESKDVYEIVKTAKGMTGAQRREMLAAIRPTEDAGPASAEERAHYERWVKVDAEISKQIKENPIAWFSGYNEAGKAAAQIIASAPPENVAAREKAYDVLLELQRNEGLDQKDITLMSKDVAEGTVSQLAAAKTGVEAQGILNQLRAQYGRHFNTVWGQLTRAGAPTSFLAMPTATVRGQNALVDTMALEKSLAESAGKDSDRGQLLRQRAGVKDQGELSKAVNEQVSDLLQAIDPSSFGLREAYRQAMEKVTLYHMLSNGKGLGEAAEQAAQDVFKSSVTVVGTAIVPNAEMQRQPEKLRLGMSKGGDAIRANAERIIPQIMPNNYGETFNRQRYVNRLIADQRWVTASEGTGVYLLDPAGGRVMVQTDTGPKPFYLSWDELRGLADTAVLGEKSRRSSNPFIFN